MKLVEPCSRMQRSTDRSQKTIVILLGIFSILPPLLGLLSFTYGCLGACNSAYRERFDKDIEFGAGAMCFMANLALQLPIYVIHILIPSGVTSARDDEPPTEASSLLIETAK